MIVNSRQTSLAVLAGLLAFGDLATRADEGVQRTDALIVGDSMMRSLSRSLEKALKRKSLTATVFAPIGTGLARLDLLDWPDRMSELARAHGATRAFVMMGANDNQPLQFGGGTIAFGTESWVSEYGRRVGKAMDALLGGGVTRVVWVGLPCMREERLDTDVRVINDIVAKQAAARAAVTFVPTHAMFSRHGNYSSYIVRVNGMPLEVRASDGIHLSRAGAELLADHLIDGVLEKDTLRNEADGGTDE